MSRFSETLMDQFQSPRNRGRMETPDAAGLAGVPGQGRHLALAVRIVGDQIAQAKFDANGCGVTIACGSALTELLIGQTFSKCAEITVADLKTSLRHSPHSPTVKAFLNDAMIAEDRFCRVLFSDHAVIPGRTRS